MEEMKADILRRAEALLEEEDEDEAGYYGRRARRSGDVAYEEELDDDGAVRVRDGHVSDEGEDESDDDADEDGEAGASEVRSPVSLSWMASNILYKRHRAKYCRRRSWNLRTFATPSCSIAMGLRDEVKRGPTSRHRRVILYL